MQSLSCPCPVEMAECQVSVCRQSVERVPSIPWVSGVSFPTPKSKIQQDEAPGKIYLLNSPFLDDLLCVLGHMVVADDVIQAGEGLLHVLLQTLQVLCLLVDRDDGVLQLHQAALKGGED